MPQAKPLVFLAFANDRQGQLGYLRLAEEARGAREALAAGRAAGLWEVEVRTDCTLAEILDVLQEYRDRIAIFHFGGHAGSYELLLELADGGPGPIDAAGLAAFLGQQQGLQLVFLNGCSTGAQTQGLLDANVSAVITTSSSIDDELATTFACRFYQGLASGAGVQVAFDESVAALRMGRVGNTRDLSREQAEHDGSWPWELHFRKGAEESTGRWSLGEAAGDPLFGIPPVPRGDLPQVPYRHLQWFSREHAEVFFGRGREIRELYQRVTSDESPPVLLFYGQSGVGKSSLLDAGLLPRLEGSCQSRYARRAQELGLLGTLHRALGNEAGGVTIAEAWQAAEQVNGQPMLVVLDQAEECFTRPDAGRPNELSELAAALERTFRDPAHRPRGKLLLSFRKEWLAEIEAALAEVKLPRAKIFLARLGREGIIEAVTGPARVPRLRDQWGLTIEDGLAEFIADELLEDPGSNIGPTLQILLTKMWAEVTKTDATHPRYDRELYLSLKRKGVLLKDFLDQQLKELRSRWDTTRAMGDTGLALDILHYHTTPLGTAEGRTADELAKAYGHVGRSMNQSLRRAGSDSPDGPPSNFVGSLLSDFKDLSLLVDAPGDRQSEASVTRLTHDTLAPLVRHDFDDSAKAGQLARHIIENRAREWAGGREGPPLDERDLGLVEGGSLGMRAWTEDEQRLVEESRRGRSVNRRKRHIQRGLLVVASAFALASAAVAWWQREVAESQEAVAASRELAAKSKVQRNEWSALDLAMRSVRTAETYEGQEALREAFYRTGQDVILPRSREVAFARLDSSGQPVGRRWTTVLWDLSKLERARGVSADRAVVLQATFSSESDTMGSAGPRYSAIVRDHEAGATVILCCHAANITQAQFSPRGGWVATESASDSTARIWDSTGNEVAALRRPGERIRYATFNHDGTRVVTATDNGGVRLWNWAAKSSVSLVGHTGLVLYAGFSPRSERIVTTGWDSTARLWDASEALADTVRRPQAVLRGHASRVNSADFSPNGQRLVTASDDATAKLWDTATGELIQTLYPSATLSPSGRVRDARFSPDGQQIVTATQGGTTKLWNAGTGELVATLQGHTEDDVMETGEEGRSKAMLRAAFSRDGLLVVTASGVGTARVFVTRFSELVDSAEARLRRGASPGRKELTLRMPAPAAP